MDEKLLFDRLKDYAALDLLPMHMPGHKRNTDRFPWLKELSVSMDITELDGFEDVVEVSRYPGIDSFISVNGSTGAILAAVRTAVRPGDLLIMARNCHAAVYHAAELCLAEVRYLLPEWDADWGVFGRVRPEAVRTAIDVAAAEGKTPAAVVLTSPTYEGDVSDIRSIADCCHERGIPLIVDEAHGAHFGLSGFPETAIRLGGDIVVQSIHKTLPSPTQTSVVHIHSDLLSAEELKRQLLTFQSTSPSFLLMAAAEKAVAYVRENGDREAAEWLARLDLFRQGVSGLDTLRLRRTDDPSKLVVSAGTDGREWMEHLRRCYGIEAEMALSKAVLFMTGMGDTKEGIQRLIRALREEADRLPVPGPVCFAAPVLPEKVMDPGKAVQLPKERTESEHAEGRISADYLWKVPPGIPFLVPGERIGADVIEKAVANGNKALYTLK